MEKAKLVVLLLPLMAWSAYEGPSSSGEPVAVKIPADCDQCKKSHQTIGVTNFVVTVTWGANSKDGKCVGTAGNCSEVAPCEFGAYEVFVTGSGPIKWRKKAPSIEWEEEIEVDGGTVSKRYGNAADPQDYWCGDGYHQVSFPDDLAAGGPVCTECEG